MPDRAVVGYVHPGTVRAEFCAWLLALSRRSGGTQEFLAVQSGPNISEARNELCRRFLTGCAAPWLFMADTDMVFGADVIDRLIAAADPTERPVISALYFGRDGNGGTQPVIYEFIRDTDGHGQPGFIVCRSGPGDDKCLRVAATGAGALLMHRDALEKIRASAGDPAAPWFRQSAQGSALFGEDMTFCLRAAGAGIPVHVCTDIRAGHMKTVMLGEVA